MQHWGLLQEKIRDFINKEIKEKFIIWLCTWLNLENIIPIVIILL
jgi:hypothetical protein